MLSRNPNGSVPEAAGNRVDTQSIYRFWSNERINAEEIRASHRCGTIERIKGSHPVVLAVQDTTDLNYSNLKKTEGIGFISQREHQQGLKVHSCLAVSADGEPLGVLHQQVWCRSERRGKREKRKRLPIESKESYRWLETQRAAEVDLAQWVKMVHMGDREADIFELFAQHRHENSDLLVRMCHNRKVAGELGYLLPTVAQAPVMGTTTVSVGRNPSRKEREATVQVKALTVTLEVPTHHGKGTSLTPQRLNLVSVEEVESPADGGKPIHWLLGTTLPIDTFEQVWQWVQWYSFRWRIERFHYTLKSGCKIEQLQLSQAERLEKALATYTAVAVYLLRLTYLSRREPERSCEEIFEEWEWRLLRRKYSPKSRSKKPPTLRQVVRWIGQLGGFLARKGDGEPGVKVLWRGLGHFGDLREGAQLAMRSLSH